MINLKKHYTLFVAKLNIQLLEVMFEIVNSFFKAH